MNEYLLELHAQSLHDCPLDSLKIEGAAKITKFIAIGFMEFCDSPEFNDIDWTTMETTDDVFEFFLDYLKNKK